MRDKARRLTIASGAANRSTGYMTANKTSASTATPRLTVVLVADTEDGDKDWHDEIACVDALAAQDIEEPFNILIVENKRHEGAPLPERLTKALPNIDFLYADATSSGALKDAAVARCETEWVAVLDADCIAAPDWLRLLMTAVDDNPDYDVFSGRTIYGLETSMQRVLNLYDRSVGDLGRNGPARYFENNGVLYRTAVVKQFPYPPELLSFSASRARLKALLAAGHKLYHVNGAVLRHHLDDYFVGDFRRQIGLANIRAYHTRNALTGLRAILAGFKRDIVMIAAMHRRYWKLQDWPLGLYMFFRIRPPEIAGIWRGIAGENSLDETKFR